MKLLKKNVFAPKNLKIKIEGTPILKLAKDKKSSKTSKIISSKKFAKKFVKKILQKNS